MAQGKLADRRVKLVAEKIERFAPGVSEVTITVTLTETSSGEAIPSQKVLFFLDGSVDPFKEDDTNESGRASAVSSDLQPGPHLVVCAIEADFVEKVSFTVPLPKIKLPTLLHVPFSGERGKQMLSITVTAEDGSVIKGLQVTVIDGDVVNTHTTGEKPYQMNFQEPTRRVEVRIGNTKDLVWQATLLGPKKTNLATQP
ncbi:MAG: hypothetical protein A3C84_01755 [Candidatus Ryanbacteria bacterium RIFCSPHIGHO2_02_FULL_48_12]|uniref:Big-1 domain-containing protein n=1 Tax=Candidatus Ryanbacteria bacterium RIFCSPHIGHO2_01_FULL_48_27 TaxID=1802115 RepID=A0A1G2G816_9BACT|nr:MAG: hypothetical protein A2756_06490 [Candidatus Ryanbacteria bacterium RIFCSPHIGHO2_01_FULL_48_27]OGZ49205.1 MAG: hypothetical protein A3C84_01755 [Candidatus Ryanbacteria bacterium RIFCSPHIGHO2_02_FULL_48_12]